jgi:hypothetical protein
VFQERGKRVATICDRWVACRIGHLASAGITRASRDPPVSRQRATAARPDAQDV